LQKITIFSAALTKDSKAREQAKALIDFLASAAAAPALVKSGMEPIAPTRLKFQEAPKSPDLFFGRRHRLYSLLQTSAAGLVSMTPRQVDVRQIEAFRMLRSRLHFVALTVLCAVATTSASSQEEQVRTDPLDRDRLSVGSGTEGAVRIVSTSDTVEVKGLLGEWHRLHPDIRTDYI